MYPVRNKVEDPSDNSLSAIQPLVQSAVRVPPVQVPPRCHQRKKGNAHMPGSTHQHYLYFVRYSHEKHQSLLSLSDREHGILKFDTLTALSASKHTERCGSAQAM